eukprot:403377294
MLQLAKNSTIASSTAATDESEYEMMSSEFDYEQLKQSPFFGIKRYKDSLYRGEIQNKKRHGQGIIVYNMNRIYEGEWVMDKREGRGFELFNNGNTYQGDYVNGKAQGKGLYCWKNGETYDGEWANGTKNGYGIWKGTIGESYIGQWKDGKSEGYGVHTWKNGDKYEGEWVAWLRHGNGTDFFSNGDVYIGQYKLGKPDGLGQYNWKNGNSYSGMFVNGLKHGKGKWKKNPSQQNNPNKYNYYEGDYEHDKKNGFGIFEWESGNKYQGQYIDDERNGFGQMEWIDGSVYKGLWEDGVQHGIGLMVFPNGSRKAGFFDKNMFKQVLQSIQQYDQNIMQYPQAIVPFEFREELIDILQEKEDSNDEQAFHLNEQTTPQKNQEGQNNQTIKPSISKNYKSQSNQQTAKIDIPHDDKRGNELLNPDSMLSGYLRLNDSDYSTDNPFPILNNIHPQNTNKTNQTQHNRANKPFNDLNLEENMPQRILPRNSDSNISFSGQNQILKPQNIKRVKFPVPGSNNQNPINLQQFYKPSSRDTFNKNHNNNNFDLQSNNESLAVDSFQDQFPNNFKGNRPQKMQNQKYYRSPIKTGRDQEIYQMGMPIIENNQSQQENSRQNNHLNLQSYQQSQMLKYMDFDLITRIDPNLKKYQRESDVGQRSNSLSKPRHYRFTSQNFNQESSQNISIPDIKPQKQLPAAPKFIQTHRQLASLQPIVRNPITYDKNKNILQSPRYGLDMDLNQKSRYLNIPSLNRLNNYHSDTNYLKPLKTLNQSSQLPKQLISLRPRAKQANHNYSKSNLLNKNASNHSSIDRNYQQTKRNSSIDSLKQYQQQSQQSIEGSGSGEINNGIKRHRVGASERVMSNYRMYQQVEQDKERFKVKYQQYQPFTQPKRIWIPSGNARANKNKKYEKFVNQSILQL